MNNLDTQKLDLLRALPYFSDLLDDELKHVEMKTTIVRLEVGEMLTEQGHDDSEVYFVCSGLVRVYLVTEEGKEKTLTLVGPESILGEVAAMTGGERTAYAEALTEVTALRISRSDFVSLVRKDSDLALNIIRGFSERLRSTTGSVEESVSFGLPERLMIVLRRLAEESRSSEISISHEELARITGSGRARVTEALNKMQENGVLEIKRRTIRLINPGVSEE